VGLGIPGSLESLQGGKEGAHTVGWAPSALATLGGTSGLVLGMKVWVCLLVSLARWSLEDPFTKTEASLSDPGGL
jgi:hypothetical protein